MQLLLSFRPVLEKLNETLNEDCEAQKYYINGNCKNKPARNQELLSCVLLVSGQRLMLWCAQNLSKLVLPSLSQASDLCTYLVSAFLYFLTLPQDLQLKPNSSGISNRTIKR